MNDVVFREPRDEHWSALTALANIAISEMESPPEQKPWAENRRLFPSDGIQRHFVAISSGRIVGYAGVEWRKGQAVGWFRVFVVVAPPDRVTLGLRLFEKIRKTLIELSAGHAW